MCFQLPSWLSHRHRLAAHHQEVTSYSGGLACLIDELLSPEPHRRPTAAALLRLPVRLQISRRYSIHPHVNVLTKQV